MKDSGLYSEERELDEKSTAYDKVLAESDLHYSENKEPQGSSLSSHTDLSLCKVLRFLPGILIVVVLSGIISYLTNSKEHGVVTLDSVESGFFVPRAPALSWDRINGVIGPSVLMMIIGFVEASAIGKIYRYSPSMFLIHYIYFL